MGLSALCLAAGVARAATLQGVTPGLSTRAEMHRRGLTSLESIRIEHIDVSDIFVRAVTAPRVSFLKDQIVVISAYYDAMSVVPALAGETITVASPRTAFVQRRITLSTVGIPAGIRRLAAENLQIKLAVSIHAATDGLRGSLVPISRRYPLDELFAAMRAYAQSTGRRLMLEWVMIDGVNDSVGQARAVVQRLEGLPAEDTPAPPRKGS